MFWVNKILSLVAKKETVVKQSWHLLVIVKGATGLYKPVGGAEASFCTNLACFTSGTFF